MGTEILGIGITGKTLTDLERRILQHRTPCAVVLFGRNIQDVVQLRELVAEIKAISATPPVFMIDEEGGRVDRLRNIVPGLPSAEAFAEGDEPVELSRWFGRVIGLALRYFDIEIDLAPVVDIRGDQPTKGLERRTFGNTPEQVVELAGAFMRGLHSAGVASCLKHFPGIGLGSADPHYGATVIDIPGEALIARDLVPFRELGDEAGAIMIGHGTYPRIDDPDLPATLSYRMTTELLRNETAFHGAAISDDMEMHAVSDLGSYEEICERALLAGNDVILYCSHIERIPDLDRFLDDRVRSDTAFAARYREAVGRAEGYRAHCNRLRAEAGPPVRSFDELIEEAIRFIERFQSTRPYREIYIPESDRRKGPRMPGKGHTGREEWT
ncbi:MAG: Beta-N-acetylhexosaminidase [Acidobacteria bacterium]|nr:Beta-N-acetylhexosaminidase [Acidobacteriota bacterium]